MIRIHALGRVLVVGRVVHDDHLPQAAAHAAARRKLRLVQRSTAVGGVVGRRLRLESVRRRAADRQRLGSRKRRGQWRRGPRDDRRLRQRLAAHRLRPLAARGGGERDQRQHAKDCCVPVYQRLCNPLHRVALRPGGILAVGAETDPFAVRGLPAPHRLNRAMNTTAERSLSRRPTARKPRRCSPAAIRAAGAGSIVLFPLANARGPAERTNPCSHPGRSAEKSR